MTAAAPRSREDGFRALAGPPAEGYYALKGHSGARVVLHATASLSYVRKTAADPSHNTRLLRQMEKQRQLTLSGIPFPRVFASGLDSEACAYFDMTYVPGRTVADAVVHAASFDAQSVLGAVDRIVWLFRSCVGETIPREQFLAKIAAIRGSANARAGDDAALKEAIDACAQRLLRFGWDGIPASPSHGDLTLENIMLGADHGIVFIDCDEAWVSSFWLDIGKLFQDIEGHWCLRDLYGRTDSAIDLANAIEKLERLAGLFRGLAEDCDLNLVHRLPQLAALHLFRALPYARDDRAMSFVCERIRRLVD